MIFRRIMIGIILVVLAWFAVSLAFDEEPWYKRLTNEKFFQELQVQTEARVFPDGSMTVKETRVLDFNGDFTRYRRQIPHRGFSEIQVIQVSEPGSPYQQVQSSAGRPEGKYTFTRSRDGNADNYNIELYFHANNEKRTFIIEYRVLDVVKVHTDVAELYWQFLGMNRTVDTDLMTVSLKIPPGAGTEDIRVWGHGPLQGDVRKISADHLFWETRNLPKSRFLEGRVLFPTRLTPQAKTITQRSALNEILAEEKKWADQTTSEKRQPLLILIASIVASVGGCILIWFGHVRFGRKFKSTQEHDYYRELPGSYSPAETGYFIEKGILKPQAVFATFMDLARRGYIRMKPSSDPNSQDVLVLKLKQDDDGLRQHEKTLLDFFFNQVGREEREVWLGALQAFQKSEPTATKTFVESFRNQVSSSVDSMEFFDKTQYIWKQTARFCSSAAFIVFFLFLIFKQIPAAISALVLAVAFLLASFRSRDFTRQGQAQYDLWLAFRRFLKDFSSLDRSKLPQLILWEHYLVYAVVLGVAEEVLRQLPAVYPELNKPENEFGRCWDSPDHSDSSSNGAVGAGGITSASFAGLTWFPAAMGSIETAFGSGDFMGNASGGGFSSGGGGGGGGGGGDAD